MKCQPLTRRFIRTQPPSSAAMMARMMPLLRSAVMCCPECPCDSSCSCRTLCAAQRQAYWKNVTSTAQRQVITLHNTAGEIIGWCDRAERAKVIDKMRLVIITVSRRCSCPIDFSVRGQGCHRPLKTADALKELWRQANLLAENPTEPSLTQSDLLQHRGNR